MNEREREEAEQTAADTASVVLGCWVGIAATLATFWAVVAAILA